MRRGMAGHEDEFFLVLEGKLELEVEGREPFALDVGQGVTISRARRGRHDAPASPRRRRREGALPVREGCRDRAPPCVMAALRTRG
jgi:hypothetical protein